MITASVFVFFVKILLTKSDAETEATSQKFSVTGQRLRDCSDLSADMSSGVYTIQPEEAGPFRVFCDMKTDGGGWTVFQRRQDGSTDFFRGWMHYKHGFGNLTREFWLGNDRIHSLTSQGQYHLRIDLEDFENQTRYALYKTFFIGDADTEYKLTVNDYSGDAGNAMSYHNGRPFITKDKDSFRCTASYKGAWWYRDCAYANLNGQYFFTRPSPFGQGVEWYQWKGHIYSLKRSAMMMKRIINSR